MFKLSNISCKNIMQEKTKGITLIGLTVTIVVILILAGISIGVVFSDDGIIEKAKEAASATNSAVKKEQEELNNLTAYLNQALSGIGGNTNTNTNSGTNSTTNTDTNTETNTVDPPPPVEEITGTVSKAGEIVWKNGTAKIELEASESGYTIQYKVNNGTWLPYDGNNVSGLNNTDTIYVRLTDGTKTGPETIIKIEDNTPPIIREVSSSSETNRITLQVESEDKETGMEESPTYKYYIKKTIEGEESYKQIGGQTGRILVYEGLEQNTSYTIKVEVEDKAGNKGTLEKEIRTEKIADADTGLATGTIVAGEVTWNNGEASIELETTSSLEVQYQIVEEGSIIGENWETYTGPITGLKDGDTVYARLWDGTNGGNTGSITILDIEEPEEAEIILSSTSINQGETLTAKVTQKDNKSGVNIAESKWKLSTSADEIGTNANSYTETFSENPEEITLNTNTAGTYYLHVLTIDNAGNKKETISEAIDFRIIIAEITLDKTNVELEVEEEVNLTAQVKPSDATNKELTWTSSNQGIIEIIGSSTNITIKGLAEGTTTITAKTKDGSEKEASCEITVNKKGINTVEEAIESGSYFEETREIKDDNDNPVTIPGGFKVVDEGNTVEEGVVVEDEIGNQFVWVPVGEISKSDGTNTLVTFGRYYFSQDGTMTLVQAANEYEKETGFVQDGIVYGELTTSRESNLSVMNGTNTTAMNLKQFIESVSNNKGYYIARYEASYGSGNSTDNWIPLSQPSTSTSYTMSYTKGELWHSTNEDEAAKISRNMYKGNSYVISDLANSYAWDTALKFISECSTVENYLKYKYDKTITLQNTGATNDVVCNIYDMASNLGEWTTEYAEYYEASGGQNSGGSGVSFNPIKQEYKVQSLIMKENSYKKEKLSEYVIMTWNGHQHSGGAGYNPSEGYAVSRGGYYQNYTSYAGQRNSQIASVDWNYYGFRPILYIGDNSGTEAPDPDPEPETENTFDVTLTETSTTQNTLTVSVKNTNGIKSIEVVELEETRNYSNRTSITENFTILENGTYTVKITYSDGTTEEKSVKATNIVVPDPVAAIGSTKYNTLTEAIAAVPTTGTQTTIVLLKDITQSVPVTIPSSKNVAIDFANSYTVTLTTGYINNLGTLKLTNGTLISEHTEKVCIANSKTVEVENMILEGPSTNAIRNNGSGTVTIRSSELTTQINPAIVNFDTASVEITNSKVTTTKANAINNVGTGSVTIREGAIITAGEKGKVGNYATIHNEAGTIEIRGGEVYGLDTNVIYNEEGEIVITGGTISLKNTLTSASSKVVIQNNGSKNISISGANTKIIAENGYAVYNNGSGQITINAGTIQGSPFAGYPTVVNDGSGGILVNGASITSSLSNVIYNNSNGTIEIAEGNITGTASNKPTIWNNTVNGQITIVGGTITSTDQTPAVYNLGSLNINSGNIISEKSNGVYNAGTGTVAMSGGTIQVATSTGLYNASTGNVTIQGGTIKMLGSYIGIQNQSTGTVRIENMAIDTENGQPIVNNAGGRIEIISGSFKAGGETTPAVINSGEGHIQVEGGEIEAVSAGIYNMGEGSITILAGTVTSTAANAIGNASTGEITLGKDDGIVSTTSPEIVSTNGYYTISTSTLNFYDGILKGGGIKEEATVNTPSGKTAVRNTTEDLYYTILQ